MIKELKFKIGRFGVWLIKFTSRKLKIDLLKLGYLENGILKSHSLEASGEIYFINSFLKEKLTPHSTFLDVGANVGDYSRLLRKSFPSATIYSFEPNPNTFNVLKKNLSDTVELINKGIGAEEGELDLYFDKENPTSVQASSNPEILKVIAHSHNLGSTKIAVTTLDNFAEVNNISQIHLLKIDIEGFELEALIGAKNLLASNAIRIIQFEFNEVNIVKRRFLKDFYDILDGFELYRLDTNRLIPLGKWEPLHEIFKFQNIIAIRS